MVIRGNRKDRAETTDASADSMSAEEEIITGEFSKARATHPARSRLVKVVSGISAAAGIESNSSRDKIILIFIVSGSP